MVKSKPDLHHMLKNSPNSPKSAHQVLAESEFLVRRVRVTDIFSSDDLVSQTGAGCIPPFIVSKH